MDFDDVVHALRVTFYHCHLAQQRFRPELILFKQNQFHSLILCKNTYDTDEVLDAYTDMFIWASAIQADTAIFAYESRFPDPLTGEPTSLNALNVAYADVFKEEPKYMAVPYYLDEYSNKVYFIDSPFIKNRVKQNTISFALRAAMIHHNAINVDETQSYLEDQGHEVVLWDDLEHEPSNVDFRFSRI